MAKEAAMTSEANSSSTARTILSSILIVVTMVMCLVFGVMGALVIPQFAQVFSSFGADLPAPTLLVINFRYLLWLPSFLMLIVMGVLWWLVKSPKVRTLCYAVFVVVQVLMLPLIIVSMYLPIYKLGQVV
jgi:type IV pilus assembly protein PilC